VRVLKDLLFRELPELFLDKVGSYPEAKKQDRNEYRVK
jgi:hypothetical protein